MLYQRQKVGWEDWSGVEVLPRYAQLLPKEAG